MSQLTDFIACPNVQLTLMEAWMKNNLAPNPVPFFEFVTSEVNRMDTIQRQLTPGSGKLRQVEVVYGQRFLESMVSDGGQISCEGGTQDGETSKIYTIDPTVGASYNWSVDPRELAYRCEQDSLYFARMVLKAMNAAIEKIDSAGLLALFSNSGNFATDVDNGNPAGTTTDKDVTFKLTNGQIDYNAIEQITFNFINNGFGGIPPMVFGGEVWQNYATALQAACCGLNGIDAGVYADQNQFKFGYTHKAPAIFGDADLAQAVSPGAIQLISYNEFDIPSLQINDGAWQQNLLTHPDPRFKGIRFDYYAKYNCEGTVKTWDFGIAVAFDHITMPEDMYQVGDRYEGVNGILRFERVNPS